MITAPNTTKMISGRTRIYSVELGGTKLTGTTHLPNSRGRRGPILPHLGFHAHTGLLKNLSVGRGDRGQERLRQSSHPKHEQEQRSDRHHLTCIEIMHVTLDMVGRLAKKSPLIKPKHIARRKNHAECGNRGPSKVY